MISHCIQIIILVRGGSYPSDQVAYMRRKGTRNSTMNQCAYLLRIKRSKDLLQSYVENVHFCILTVSYDAWVEVKLHCDLAYAICVNSAANLMKIQSKDVQIITDEPSFVIWIYNFCSCACRHIFIEKRYCVSITVQTLDRFWNILLLCGPHIPNVILTNLKQFKGVLLARFVTSNYSYASSVTAMMEVLNWNTLYTRRNIHRLIRFYKILHKMVDISLPESIFL